jgi:maleate isomerase
MSGSRAIRVGQIVPSSNTTMETEVPALLHARELVAPERFTFHSSRMRMKQVTAAELAKMDGDSDRCADELSDARVDVLAYACLVAIMASGKGYHRDSSHRLHARTLDNGAPAPVVTSAGALVEGLSALGVQSIAIVTPYLKPLTQLVIAYLEHEGFRVLTSISLEIADNLEVGARDPMSLVETAGDLDLSGVDAIVLSACVQMPSLAAVPIVQDPLGLPVLTASICTAYAILRTLGLSTGVPDAGALLDGSH